MKTVELTKKEVWKVDGIACSHPEPPRVDVVGPGTRYSVTGPVSHWIVPPEVNTAIASEWERVRPLADDEVRYGAGFIVRVRWEGGDLQFLTSTGLWVSRKNEAYRPLLAALDAWATAHPEPLRKDQWRARNGDVWTFRRNPETKMPEHSIGLCVWSGLECLPEGHWSGERAALLAWARENPVEREGRIQHLDAIYRLCWDGDVLAINGWRDSAAGHLIGSKFRSALRAWIARTRPEMLPVEEAKAELWTAELGLREWITVEIPKRFAGKRVRVTVEVVG